MPTTFEYDNDVRKICLTLSSSIDFKEDSEFLLFLSALDALNEAEAITKILLVAAGAEFDLFMTTVNGPKLDYRLVVTGPVLFVSMTSTGTLWVAARVDRADQLRDSIYILIKKRGLSALEIDYF